jgi:hypothetical protein
MEVHVGFDAAFAIKVSKGAIEISCCTSWSFD